MRNPSNRTVAASVLVYALANFISPHTANAQDSSAAPSTQSEASASRHYVQSAEKQGAGGGGVEPPVAKQAISVEKAQIGIFRNDVLVEETTDIPISKDASFGWQLKLKLEHPEAEVHWKEDYFFPLGPELRTAAEKEGLIYTNMVEIPKDGWIRKTLKTGDHKPGETFTIKIYVNGALRKTFKGKFVGK